MIQPHACGETAPERPLARLFVKRVKMRWLAEVVGRGGRSPPVESSPCNLALPARQPIHPGWVMNPTTNNHAPRLFTMVLFRRGGGRGYRLPSQSQLLLSPRPYNAPRPNHTMPPPPWGRARLHSSIQSTALPLATALAYTSR
jgi:hypothetical protein